MTYFAPAWQGVRREHSGPRANGGVAIVALPAMAADRCFASPEDLMRPGGMRAA